MLCLGFNNFLNLNPVEVKVASTAVQQAVKSVGTFLVSGGDEKSVTRPEAGLPTKQSLVPL